MNQSPTNTNLQEQIQAMSERLAADALQRDRHRAEMLADIAEMKAVLHKVDEALFVPQPGQDKPFFYLASAMVADRVALGRVAKFFIWVVGALAALGITITLRMQDK
jgi:hypothetical protein